MHLSSVILFGQTAKVPLFEISTKEAKMHFREAKMAQKEAKMAQKEAKKAPKTLRCGRAGDT